MTLRELAEALDAELLGASGDEEVLGVAGLDTVKPGFVTYAEDERRLAQAEATPALAVIAPPGLRASHKPLLASANPRLTFAWALARVHPPMPRLAPGVHPSAQLGEGVALGDEVAIGAYCIVGDGVRIGPRTQLHPLVSIGPSTVIGADCVIYPHVALYHNVRLGDRVVVHAGTVIGSPGFGYVWDGEQHLWIPHVGTVVVEDDVEIGADTCIDRGTTGATVIGKGTKIDNQVQVAHNVAIGRNSLLAAQVGLSGTVTLEEGVTLAGQAGVADHVKMGKGSTGAAGSDIIRDIPPGQVVYGRPARPLGEQLRIDAAAAHLPEMVREIRQLRKRIEELEKRLRDT
jgi:UDP-3-O-[3-hydroxymyristoyl] glucosamine N-acyltransferase